MSSMSTLNTYNNSLNARDEKSNTKQKEQIERKNLIAPLAWMRYY